MQHKTKENSSAFENNNDFAFYLI